MKKIYIFLIQIVFIGYLGLYCSSYCSAQQKEENKTLYEMTLEELMHAKVVSASRSEKTIERLPATIYVIDKEEIDRNHYSSLVDVLKDIPGIKVSQPGSGTDGETFLMRGLYGNYYTKILKNSVPISPSVTGGMPIGEQINIKSIDRIEIVYGPAAALYGADAVSGVINIITKPYEKSRLECQLEIGENGYLNRTFNSVYTFGKKNKLACVSIHGLLGKHDDKNIKQNYKDILNRENYSRAHINQIPYSLGKLPGESQNFGFDASYSNFRFTYDYMFRSEHSSLGLRSDEYFYDDPSAQWGETMQQSVLQHKFKFNNSSLQSSLSYLQYRLNNDTYFSHIYANKDTATYGYRNYDYKFQASDDIIIDENFVWHFNKNVELVGGLSFQYSGAFPKTNDLEKPFKTSDYGIFSNKTPGEDSIYGYFGYNPITYHNTAGFMHTLISYDFIDFMLGFRYDYHSEYKDCFNPRTSVQFHFNNNTSIRASYTTAFKAPAPYYTYHSWARVSKTYPGCVNYICTPNTKIKPEKLYAYEVGLRHLFSKNISVEIIGYQNKINKLISLERGLYSIDYGYQNCNEKDKMSIYTNDGNAETKIYGLDGIINLRNIINPIKLNTTIQASYAKGEEVLPGGEEKLKNRRMLPEWIYKLNFSVSPHKNIFLKLDNFYCTHWYARNINSIKNYENPDNKIDGYYTLDVVLNYNLFKYFNLYCKIINCFDEKYGGIQAYEGSNLLYNPQPGRTAYAGLTFTKDFSLD